MKIINTNEIFKEIEDLFSKEKFKEIIELLSEEDMSAIAEKDAIAELYIWRGNARYEQKDYDNAIIDYNKAIEINQNYSLAYFNRAFALIGKKEYTKAIEDYDRVINQNPDYLANAYTIKGSVLRAMKKYCQAIKYYNKAIKLDPNYANAYFNRGIAKKEYNVDLLGSKKDFERFIEITNALSKYVQRILTMPYTCSLC